MGESTISMAIFNSYVSHNQRVNHLFWLSLVYRICRNPPILAGERSPPKVLKLQALLRAAWPAHRFYDRNGL